MCLVALYYTGSGGDVKEEVPCDYKGTTVEDKGGYKGNPGLGFMGSRGLNKELRLKRK